MSTTNGASRAKNGQLHGYLVSIMEREDCRYTGTIESMERGIAAQFELELHLPIDEQTRECREAYLRCGVPGLEHVLNAKATVTIDGVSTPHMPYSMKEPILLAYGLLLNRKRRFQETAGEFNIYC